MIRSLRGRSAPDAEERLIRKLPHDFAEKVVWGSRYPHHDTTSATDAIDVLRKSGVTDELIARMMGANAASQFGVALASSRSRDVGAAAS